MPLVIIPICFACCAERLAGARTCPNWSIVRPPSASQGKGPDPDACEEMALCVFFKVVWSDIFDTPFVYIARGNVAGIN
jgi:hypothetical protein